MLQTIMTSFADRYWCLVCTIRMNPGIYSQAVSKVSKLQVTIGMPAETRYHGHEVTESLSAGLSTAGLHLPLADISVPRLMIKSSLN